MTRELKEKWLEALKSGKYIQGSGQLTVRKTNITKHCCLAVLGEICNLEINNNGIVFIEDESNRNEYEGIYPSLNKHLTKSQMNMLVSYNDAGADGKYTAVIPIIEKIETVD